MKRLMTAAVLFTAALGAQTAEDKQEHKTNTPASAPVAPVTIPKDALKNENGSYTWTDKQGQRWIYANTPFGVMKSPEQSADNVTIATDKGDTVHFEHATPFGLYKWDKKKSELTDEDRAIIDKQNHETKKQTETAKSDQK